MSDLTGRIADWISAQVERAGVKGALVGLSGGVDSAVVAALLKRALGERSLGIVIPCESDPRDAEDAMLVARAVGIETATVDLDAAFRALVGELPEGKSNRRCTQMDVPQTAGRQRAGIGKRTVGVRDLDGSAFICGSRLARANLKPRLRMAALYYYANRLSYLVAGTGNRSEIMLGYFTKFGDGGADILPLGRLLKRDVRALARELGVPEAIIGKPPSAGLVKGQTDEGDLGVSYEDIDRALASLDCGDTSGVPPDVLERVKGLIKRSAHKRAPAPVFEPDVRSR